MAVFRIEKTKDYTIMANHHLKNRNLSLKAKGLLSVILSLPNDWNYTTRGLASICKEGVDSIGAALKELEATGYILRNRIRDSKGRITDTEYVIYEKPCSVLETEKQDTASPSTEPPCTENPYMDEAYTDTSDTENPAQLNTKESNTNPERTQTTKSIHQSHPTEREMERCRARVELQIEYDVLLENNSTSAAQLDEIVELVTETLCSGKEIIRVGGEDYPAEVIKGRFAKLTGDHVEYVMSCLKKKVTPVRNIRSYLLTALYNAPTSMDSYYIAEFNRHYYSEGGCST